MNGQEIKGRLDRIGKTVLEHFQDIKELEVADGPEITVEDILPYKCERVEKSLKALEIIKELLGKHCKIELVNGGTYYQTTIRIVGKGYSFGMSISKEEFNILKEVLE